MNLFALLCRRSGVTLCKVASETPLSFHYPFLVADEFTLSSAYHLEEKEALSGGHFVDRYLFWTPTKIFDVLERYLSGDSLSPPRFEVGFVSSGIWLRRRMGQKEAVPGYFASEEALLEALRDYLEGRNIRLKIYLHPLERRNPDHYREAVAYYRDFFGDFPVEVGDGETNTREHFEEVDICVAAASTTLIERLFFGFKALYAPFFIPTFPLPGTTLARISAKDRETFFKLLDRWIGVPAQTFFAENALEKFHHTHFGRIVDRYLASRGEKAHIPEVRSRP
ncbi:MAG: hypothetical protein D6795_08130 [Deltaproteobacteria bacterium]|nr:MAG: hypothetical protein D6795_08130 [Deltaproteobacteria bacterium]